MRLAILVTLVVTALNPNVGSAAQEYPSLDGVDSMNTVFDFRIADEEEVKLFLDIIHFTFEDDSISSPDHKPNFTVVISDKAVALFSTSHLKPNEALHTWLDNKLIQMIDDGINIEFCRAAAGIMNVDPTARVDAVLEIDNAWISLMGYQAKDFSMIPVY